VGILSPKQSDVGVKLTGHLHLVPSFRIPPLSNSFLCCGA